MLFYCASLPLSRQTLDYATGVIRRHRKIIGSKGRVLNPGVQALMVLVYLRKGETFADLGAGFGVSTTAWRYVNEAVALLPARSPKLGQLRKAKTSGLRTRERANPASPPPCRTVMAHAGSFVPIAVHAQHVLSGSGYRYSARRGRIPVMISPMTASTVTAGITVHPVRSSWPALTASSNAFWLILIQPVRASSYRPKSALDCPAV